jgi:hypothetical protein
MIAGLCALSTVACEPIIPFMQVVGGPAIVTGSAIALVIAVALKSLLFAMLQKRLSYVRAVLLMIGGNVITTFVGLIVAAMMGSAGLTLIGMPVVWVLCWMPSKRVAMTRNVGTIGLATAMTFALLVSVFFFAAAQGVLLDNQLVLYWGLKLTAVYLALIVSILLSVFWEEWFVWRVSRLPEEETFFAPVLRANIYVLLIIMVYAAAVVVPRRLSSPDFLVRLVRAIVAVAL